MDRQRVFTFMELMEVIAIIAILGAIALPGYQRYLDRAALIDMLADRQSLPSYGGAVRNAAG